MVLYIGKDEFDIFFPVLLTKYIKNTDIIYKTNIRWLWKVVENKQTG